MKILLTGATGTIGGSILRSLKSAGHEVTCAVRNLPKAKPLSGPKVFLHELPSSSDPQSQFYEACKGHFNIIHSGFLNTGDPAEAELETKVITGILAAAKESSAKAKTTLVVTTGALCMGESTRLLGEDEVSNANCLPMLKGRVAHEEMVIAAASKTLITSIMRPTCIYGGSHVDHYFKACKEQGKIVVPHGNGTVSYIHKEDLGEIYRLVIENSGSGFFTASEGLGPNLDQVIEIAKRVTGVQKVERVDNVWAHVHTYGFYLFELTLNSMFESKRAREMYGFKPKHLFQRDAQELLKL